MTPQEVLEQTEFPQVFPILPERFPTFDDLVKWRFHIRDLIILPVKSDEMRAYYKTLDKESLAKDLHKIIGDSRFLLRENEFPYMVPENTSQYIIWIKNQNETRESVAEFIKMTAIDNKWDLEDVILFERPLGISTKLVRGTFPLIRHVHLWVRQ